MDKKIVKVGDKIILAPADPAVDFDELAAQSINKIEEALGLEITNFEEILKLRRKK